MPGVKDLKLRIRAVKSTQQITKAMKMVAAARIKRAETRVKAFRPYADRIREMAETMQGCCEEPHPYSIVRPEVKRIGLLLVTSDKGLCGPYNSNLARMAQTFLDQRSRKNCSVDLLTIGNKGKLFFTRRGHSIGKNFSVSFAPEYGEAKEIAGFLSKNFLNGTWDEVWAISSLFVSALSQKPSEKLLLPLSRTAGKGGNLFLIEPDPASVLNFLLIKNFYAMIYRVLLESRAAELGARLVAMGNATENAEKLINSLTLQFYRARQESITKEILEVASGAEALTG